MMRNVHVAALLVTIPCCLAGRLWMAEDLANPKHHPSTCGQRTASSICDPERLLGQSSQIQAALNALYADYKYPGCGGYEMAVAVVGRVKGSTAGDMEKFAKSLIDKWGVGNAACNNGILLAMAIEDRLIHIATGRGAAEHVPNEELLAIIERMKPLMRESRFSDATVQAVSDIARVLSGEHFAQSGVLEKLFWAVLIVFFVGTSCVSAWQERKYARCKRVLSQIERERAAAKAERYQAVSCAICLETFADTPAMKTRILACGHKFHSRCVTTWEGTHGNCPICRESTQNTLTWIRMLQNQNQITQTSPSIAESGTANSRFHGSSMPLLSSYDEEYRFRVRRARAIYPDFISESMMNRWCTPCYSGPIVADTAFIRSSPSYGQSSSGSGGGSSSFGGGCSDGGGGAGGSW
eukprot:TRINITY_DN94917_c0_g1_i1.p1 TRINITY_DN94917_c0_g1~~TRINITY_DN94917_c0_g1_i1.p1  ORF type:complete len:417 (-),score=44.57 TRINITY_DN94917_c0_g1_i1:29-1258(-)